jgi:hypothetical protein
VVVQVVSEQLNAIDRDESLGRVGEVTGEKDCTR